MDFLALETLARTYPALAPMVESQRLAAVRAMLGAVCAPLPAAPGAPRPRAIDGSCGRRS